MSFNITVYNTGKIFMQKEFSYPLSVADLPLSLQHYHLLANADNLAFLTKVLQVPEVKSFDADFYVKPDHNTSILKVSGHIKAELVLQSVISLENFDQKYDFDFETIFDTKATLQEQKEEGDDWDKDTPDVVINGKIDLGDIAIEQVALRLDDYPRQDGEKFSFIPDFDPLEKPADNPFAVLAKLKK